MKAAALPFFPSPRRLPAIDPWRALPWLFAGMVLAPVAVVASAFFTPAGDVWRHLAQTTLTETLLNTLWLALGVGTGATLIGTGLAWLTACCEFPGRRFFSWALLLPLAVPAYVTAFVAVGLLDYAGPVQTALRGWLGGPLGWFPAIRGRGGAIAVMTLALYPYVYILARNAFLTQGRRALEAAQTLGLSRTQGFFRVALPLARPWIAAGAMLALMETLADFGTVSVFNVDTLTTAIYKAWFALFSLPAAAQMASLLVLVAFAALLAEQQSRSRMRYGDTRPGPGLGRIPLTGARRWLALGFALTVWSAGFLIPVAKLTAWAATVWARDLDRRYLDFVWHSVLLSALAAGLTVTAGLLVAYASRRHGDLLTRAAVRLATMGYALPGAVLAVGIVIPLAWLDRHLSEVAQHFLQARPGLLIQGTLAAMLVAYVCRFLAVAHGPVDSAMQRITPNLDAAATTLGLSGGAVLARVHLPMLRGGLLTGAVLVFVDVMKEMPITLMTRPFGWDTLAIRIFEMTSEGEWERAALPALALVLVGLLPIAHLIRRTEA